MKFKDFHKTMAKPTFTLAEAERVAWETSSGQLKLQLYQWSLGGDVVRLKRGVYAFPEHILDKVDIARALYEPAAISLEYALHHHGLIPDVPFAMTLVTPRITRRFQNSWGQFIYHKIKQSLFWGYDPQTLMTEKEKALLDTFYLFHASFKPESSFWHEARLQNLVEIDFKKLQYHARKYPDVVRRLVTSLMDFSKTDGKS